LNFCETNRRIPSNFKNISSYKPAGQVFFCGLTGVPRLAMPYIARWNLSTKQATFADESNEFPTNEEQDEDGSDITTAPKCPPGSPPTATLSGSA
jgi:hypothetical protein